MTKVAKVLLGAGKAELEITAVDGSISIVSGQWVTGPYAAEEMNDSEIGNLERNHQKYLEKVFYAN